jgi:hypothetical protein
VTQHEAMQAMRKLVAAFPHPAVAEETILVYVERLLPLETWAVARAVNLLIDADLQHLPRVGRIRHLALDLQARAAEHRRTQQLLLPDPLDTQSPAERAAAKRRVLALLAELPFMRKTDD